MPCRSTQKARCRGTFLVLLQKDQNRLETFISGSWGWFALLVLVNFLAPVVEELFFRADRPSRHQQLRAI